MDAVAHGGADASTLYMLSFINEQFDQIDLVCFTSIMIIFVLKEPQKAQKSPRMVIFTLPQYNLRK